MEEYGTPTYPTPRVIDESLDDLTSGCPGAIIETEEQLAIKARIVEEMERGTRVYTGADAQLLNDYSTLVQDEEAEYEDGMGDDPDALDAATLGSWTI